MESGALPAQVSLSVTYHLLRSDEALDKMLDAVAYHAAQGTLARGAAALAGYRRAMLARLTLEEDILFARLDRRAGLFGGPTAVMREEHRQIRWLLDLMHAALTHGSGERFLVGRLLMNGLLGPHRLKEGRVLYPLADRVLLPPEKTEVIQRLQRP